MNFAFEELLMKDCFFECRKDNAKANNFYTRFGSKIFGEENIDYLYNLSILDFVNIKKNINNILKY
jgi:ribosomal protein S18 acetylase RimI-like enzyme